MMGEVKGYLNEMAIEIDKFDCTPSRLAEVINMVDEGTMGRSLASQQLFPLVVQHPSKTARTLAEEFQLVQVGNEDELQSWIQQALDKYPEKVQEYRGGKKGIIGLFMGEVMRLSQGKADPKITSQLIQKALDQ